MATKKTKTGADASVNAPAQPYLREAALVFLRGLARNNRREWFEARRAVFEEELRQPMLAIVRAITDEMAAFAPAHVRPAEKCVMRIYRDIRFSHDKRPYKSHTAAWWSRAGMEKTSGAGFYLHISEKEVHAAAGAYMPGKEQLLAIRGHILTHHERLEAILAAKELQRLFRPMEGNALSRTPKGFPAGTVADALLRQRQWGVSASLPAADALRADFARRIAGHFRTANALVEFLNAPLSPPAEKRRPIFGLR